MHCISAQRAIKLVPRDAVDAGSSSDRRGSMGGGRRRVWEFRTMNLSELEAWQAALKGCSDEGT